MGTDTSLKPLRFLALFGRPKKKKTSPAPQDGLAWIALRDQHPQWGRFRLRLNAGGKLHLHLPDAQPEARRLAFQIAPDAFRSLEKLVQEHNLMDIHIQDRAGLPNEPRATLEAHWHSGLARAVGKWSSDDHTVFDAIRQRLLNLVAQVYDGDEPDGKEMKNDA